jgi:hypothetical protein
MAFKLIESAQRRWRAVNAPHLVALVRAGADKGRTVERPDDQPDHESGDDAQAARTLDLWVANEICPLTATDLPAVVTTWRGWRQESRDAPQPAGRRSAMRRSRFGRAFWDSRRLTAA